jgi:hypothetical protein
VNSRTVAVGLVALAIVTAAVVVILWGTRENVIGVKGEISRVRVHEISPGNTILILDLKITNPYGQYFGVADVAVQLEASDGQTPEPMIVSDVDAQRLFTYFPVLGQKTAKSLIMRDRINAGETVQRMLAVRFPVPAKAISDRKSLRLTITETDGKKVEITETQPPRVEQKP